MSLFMLIRTVYSGNEFCSNTACIIFILDGPIKIGRHHNQLIEKIGSASSGIVDDELYFLTECQHLLHYRESLYETAMKYNVKFTQLSEKICLLVECSYC